ncbi:MAG TPA: hypothetical protein VGO23_21565 [Pseudonocardia sp.]|nr:hypothetical protein [Pseudonocardia sp.]
MNRTSRTVALSALGLFGLLAAGCASETPTLAAAPVTITVTAAPAPTTTIAPVTEPAAAAPATTRPRTTTTTPRTTTRSPRTTVVAPEPVVAAAAPAPRRAVTTTAKPARSSGCDPNYSGCVPIDSDVDCQGGSGNGPSYVTGPVRVTGNDIYRLDADKDGVGCE